MNDLARVARATNQAEAEFVQALLLEAGIPSMLRRSPGFDVPDMLAAGPRDVMVPSAAQSGARGPAPGRDRDRRPRGRGPTHARAAAGPRAQEAPRSHADLPPGRGP